ncbi:MAG: acyl-CoA thioesterase [Bacteroidales bacterium]|jgi:acyl-CoA thioester hydrolase|nr:acyl-CoA thioesterase [Bacteroidales bacterium]
MKDKTKAPLIASTEIDIHFYDIDAVQMVWHGNYVKYLENGREAFGSKFGFEYMYIYDNGYIVPIVDLHVRYLHAIRFGEQIIVETQYIPCDSAKLMFNYRILRKSDRTVAVEASTIQLFMTKDGVFETSTPEFYRKWKKKWINSSI